MERSLAGSSMSLNAAGSSSGECTAMTSTITLCRHVHVYDCRW